LPLFSFIIAIPEKKDVSHKKKEGEKKEKRKENLRLRTVSSWAMASLDCSGLTPKWQDVEDLPKNGKSCQCINEPFGLVQDRTYSNEVV